MRLDGFVGGCGAAGELLGAGGAGSIQRRRAGALGASPHRFFDGSTAERGAGISFVEHRGGTRTG